ncbi:MAG: hypothetical protein ABIO83_05340 [Ilumatobacteraceae bacterium]
MDATDRIPPHKLEQLTRSISQVIAEAFSALRGKVHTASRIAHASADLTRAVSR